MDIIRILVVTDIDNPGLKEDCFIAKSFINDGHHVTIARQDYDEKLDELYDVILLRNIWHLDSNEYIKYKDNILKLKQRLKEKKIPTINLYSRFDDEGKLYLVELYNEGYPVIPTSSDISSFNDYSEDSIFLLKPLKSYDGYGILEKNKKEIRKNEDYIIQPKINFIKEVEFYFINKQFQFVLEFVPSKKPIYPIPKLYDYTANELNIAQQFANLCNDDFVGVQRIDFLKTSDNQLLLLEIGDSAPYLNLNSLDEKTRSKFLNNYKNMVYNYLQQK
ncbi:MAG: hypothetical protein ACI4OT_02400 [Bacilli bacterium]